MWLVGVGGIYGCGCKEVYTSYYLSLLFLYLLFFTAAFVNLFLMFFVLVPVLF